MAENIFELLVEKAKANNNTIDIEDIVTHVDLDTPEYDEIENKLEDLGITITFSEEDIPEEEVVDDKNFKYSNDVALYLHEISRFDLLSQEEEVELGKKIEKGNEAKKRIDEIGDDMSIDEYNELQKVISEADKAREKLINCNLKLVISIAKKYAFINKMSFSDLIQEGNMGLIKSIEKFDYRKNYKFSTYATWWIRQCITRSIADQSRTIRLPVHVYELKNRYTKVKNRIENELQREASDKEIADEMGISIKKIQELHAYNDNVVSLDAGVGEEKDATLEDFVYDENAMTPEDFTIKNHMHRELYNALNLLTPRERRILELRFGLDGNGVRSLEETSTEFDITRERVRQIEVKALRKLKMYRETKGLQEFIHKN